MENNSSEAAMKQSKAHVKHSPELQKQLQSALAQKGSSYKPRTEHFDDKGQPLFTNRLILEDSPYLLQHAHNPVDWYAWGSEAFAKAKAENKPVFLSIGYSTCHWCHVMERESFEDLTIASLLNDNYIAIKVDREQRPDLDATYMTAVSLITGQGGWPMSSFLTTDGKTFYAGTYFDPSTFYKLLNSVHSSWQDKQPQILQQADRIAESVAAQSANHQASSQVSVSAVKEAVGDILSQFDELQGGFGQAPKFPSEPSLWLLLNQLQREPDPSTMQAVVTTLNAMAQGGIYDQVGGGFHRYSTDNQWLVPHFEKMLYNQANLAQVYLLAWQITGDPEYRRIVTQTLDYVLREMTSKQGGVYSATDADSEGEEGLFFVWTKKKIDTILDKEDAKLATKLYQITKRGNFEGKNILNRDSTFAEFATVNKIPYQELVERIDKINRKLLEVRQKRIPPLIDKKIITAWNGMMISAFALAGDALQEPKYLRAARRTAKLISDDGKDSKSIDQGNLFRASLDQKASVSASQEDYAYFAEALLHLYDIEQDQKWLDQAIKVSERMISLFWDEKNGGFFMGNTESFVAGMGRTKDSFDSAIPSGNSVALSVLEKLSRRTNNIKYKKLAEQLLSSFSGKIAQHPSGYAYLLKTTSDLFDGETGYRQYAANGMISLVSKLSGKQLSIEINIKKGWHINSDQPLEDFLIPTRIEISENNNWKLSDIKLPKGEVKSLSFQQKALSIYQGKLSIEATLGQREKNSDHHTPSIRIHLQACDDQKCLAPERISLNPLIIR